MKLVKLEISVLTLRKMTVKKTGLVFGAEFFILLTLFKTEFNKFTAFVRSLDKVGFQFLHCATSITLFHSRH